MAHGPKPRAPCRRAQAPSLTGRSSRHSSAGYFRSSLAVLSGRRMRLNSNVRLHIMRTPSRRMPKLAPPERPAVAMLALAAFVAFVAYFGYRAFSASPWVSAAVVLVVACAVSVAGRRRKRRLAALAAERAGESICEFARSFNAREVDTWVVRAVYEQLQNYLASDQPAFPVRSSDRLVKGLLEDPDDLDLSLVNEIAERTGRSLEGAESNPLFGKVHTVCDLVLFFNAQPKSATLYLPTDRSEK